jgi:preprotein translocase SecE subunit
MARQTRAQRRARRSEAAPADGAGASRARATTQQQAARSVPARAPEVGERRVPGKGFKNFVGESWAELKKVEWPRQNQLIQGVVVVLVACIVVGVFLYANDLVWKRFVQHVLLR